MTKFERDLARRFPEWEVAGKTRKGHVRLRHKVTGRMWFAPSTPSDHRAMRNLATDLRRIAGDDSHD